MKFRTEMKIDEKRDKYMTSICVFCGSSPGRDPKHMALATRTGKAIAARGYRLVYGGGGLGLMGAVARAAHKAGGDVLGVIPEFLLEAERTLKEVEHIFVPNMHIRKITMYEESDGFIVLPGGIGTLEEAVEVLSWMRLNLHAKPVVFLDDTDYWKPFMEGIAHIIEEGFTPESFAEDVLSTDTPKDALDIIEEKIANPRQPKPLNIRPTV